MAHLRCMELTRCMLSAIPTVTSCSIVSETAALRCSSGWASIECAMIDAISRFVRRSSQPPTLWRGLSVSHMKSSLAVGRSCLNAQNRQSFRGHSSASTVLTMPLSSSRPNRMTSPPGVSAKRPATRKFAASSRAIPHHTEALATTIPGAATPSLRRPSQAAVSRIDSPARTPRVAMCDAPANATTAAIVTRSVVVNLSACQARR